MSGKAPSMVSPGCASSRDQSGRRDQAASSASCAQVLANLIDKGKALMPSTSLNAPLLNSIILSYRFQHMNWGRSRASQHSDHMLRGLAAGGTT